MTVGVKPDNFRGLDYVLVEKEAVLDAIRANRESHRDKFEEAIAGYRDKAVQLLQEHVERILRNAPERVIIDLPWPEDHSDDYDRVIEQLEFSVDDKLELSEQEFNKYVRDEWGWQQGFGHTYALYTQ